jgi:ribonucleoside-diphosphate reductase alpha chain
MTRDKTLKGQTTQLQTGCGPVYITINGDPPIEVLITMGKAGGCAAAQCETIGRMVTLALRHGAAVDDIRKHLAGIACHSPAGFGDDRILSCADAVAKALGGSHE